MATRPETTEPSTEVRQIAAALSALYEQHGARLRHERRQVDRAALVAARALLRGGGSR